MTRMGMGRVSIPPVLVVRGKTVDHDGYGEGEDENSQKSAEPPGQLAGKGGRVELVAHSGQGHHGVPKVQYR